MLKNALLAFLILCGTTAQSQNLLLIDSLTKESQVQTSDSLKAKIYSDLNYQWAEYNFDSAWMYAKKTLNMGYQMDDPIIIAHGMRGQGLAFDYQNEFDSAIHYYRKAADFSTKNGDINGHASAIFNLGVVHSFKGEMEHAIENYRMSTIVFEEVGNDRMLGIAHNNMGIIYRKTGKYELAKNAYKKSLAIKEKRNDQNGILNTLTNISTTYRFLELYDSAIIFSNRAIDLARKMSNKTAYLHEIVNLAFAYEKIDNMNAANEMYLEAETLLNEETPYETKAQVLNAQALYHYELGNYQKAATYLKRMEEDLDKETKLEIAYEFFNLAHLVQEKQGNLGKALEYLRLAMGKKEELLDNEVLSKTTELEQLYEKDKREAEIAQLNVENKLQSVELEKKRKEQLALIAVGSLILAIVVLLFFLIRQIRKSLHEKETLLQEIHHRVKNNLQVISSLLKLQAGNLEDEAAIKAVKEGESRVKAMALIHQRLYGHTDLKGVDVQDYLENLFAEIFFAFGVNQELISYSVKSKGIKLDIDTVIPLGLIINELITNTIKYAFDATDQGSIEISIIEKEDRLIVAVQDNGKGLNEEDLKKSNSFGWKMINSLSRKLEAEIDVRSENGTKVELSISNYKLV